jgi:hypothetical protein
MSNCDDGIPIVRNIVCHFYIENNIIKSFIYFTILLYFILYINMDTNLSQQFLFLAKENTGTKLEKVIEQILESNMYNVYELYTSPNVQAVKLLIFN